MDGMLRKPEENHTANTGCGMITCTRTLPPGRVLLASDGTALTGLWLEGQRHYAAGLPRVRTEGATSVFVQALEWLRAYFNGERPALTLPLSPQGSDFQRLVWERLLDIPYGETTSYGALSLALEAQTGRRCSPRAVGGAVARNPISILIPCHRVTGTGGAMTGYAGGIELKEALLRLEQGEAFRL